MSIGRRVNKPSIQEGSSNLTRWGCSGWSS